MATTVANPADLDLGTPSGNNAPAQLEAPRGMGQGATRQNLPANNSASALAVSGGLANIMSQPAVTKAMPTIIVMMAVALFLLAYSWIQAPPYKTVYPGLSESDRQAAYTALTGAEYSAKIDSKTGELKVPDNRYHEARMFLASRGLPQGSSAGGMSTLNDDTSMTTSQFMEQVRYVNAMEHELARSITQIRTIQGARVHLASPKQSVFVRNRTPAKASVVVTPFAGRIISESQVQAIIHMVASSIPYLSADDVSVVDQRGKLLTDTNSFASMQLNSEQMSHKQRMEETYRNRIDAFLTPVVGMGNVRSEVDVKIDFTEIDSTFEEYDGNDNGPRARSEVVTLEKGSAGLALGIPGAASNIGEGQNSEGNTDSDNMSTVSSKTTRNYEMDRSVRHVKRQGGTLERISVAVVINELSVPVNDTQSEAEEGADKDVGYSERDIERFTDLIKGVVGFDAARGDVVTIVSTPFERLALIEETPVPWYENTQIVGMVKSTGVALAFIALLFFAVRPAIKTYTTKGRITESGSGKDGELTQADLNMLGAANGASLKDIRAKLKPKRSGISADMLDTANTYDDKVALVRLLVADDAGRVANVLKKMIRPA
jgi:flagellar M-ring protein FliF